MQTNKSSYVAENQSNLFEYNMNNYINNYD